MDVYVLLIIATLAAGEERAEEYRSYHSLSHCERHLRAAPGAGRRCTLQGQIRVPFAQDVRAVDVEPRGLALLT